MKKLLIIMSLFLATSTLMAEDKSDADNANVPVLVYTNGKGTVLNIEVKDTREEIVFHMYSKGGKDLTNKMVYITDTPLKKEVDISNLKPGVYIIWYHANDAYRANKLIKT